MYRKAYHLWKGGTKPPLRLVDDQGKIWSISILQWETAPLINNFGSGAADIVSYIIRVEVFEVSHWRIDVKFLKQLQRGIEFGFGHFS